MSTGGSVIARTEVHVTANYDEMMRGFKEVKAQAEMTGRAVGEHIERGSRQARYSLLYLSYAVDDIQYGFRSIVNNIPQIVMGFGGSAGLAGAAQIAAVAINQLINHWGDLTDALSSAWSGQPIEQLRRVREAAEEAAKAWEKLSEAPTKMEAKSAKAIQEAIIEGPADALQKGLADAIAQNPVFQGGVTDKEQMRIDAARHFDDANERRRIIHEEMAARMLGEAARPGKQGDQARLSIRGMIRDKPNLFPGNANDLANALDPESIKRQDDFNNQAKVRATVDKHIKEDIAKRDAAREKELSNQARIVREREARVAKDNALADMLNREGWHNEDQMNREKKQELEKEEREDERLRQNNRRIREQIERERQHVIHNTQAMINRNLAQDIKMPERGEKSTMQGIAEFSKFIQTGILNADRDIPKRQLEQLNAIRQLLAQNAVGQAMVGAGGVAALAALPN